MSDNTDTQTAEVKNELLQLNDLECRILGALMEKQLTTPDAYPLTLNSLQLACNQKTSREPVMSLTPAQVQQTINDLRQRQLIEVDYGSRADRYKQLLSKQLFLDKAQQAMVSVMLLRGPQTIAELFTRTQRMTEFSSTEATAEKIDIMCQKTTPIIQLLPRKSGQREDRYMHLLNGDLPEADAQSQNVSLATVNDRKGLSGGSTSEPTTEIVDNKNYSLLIDRIEALEARVAELEKLI